MADDGKELAEALSALVQELKRGILLYAEQSKRMDQGPQRQHLESVMGRMHQAAIKINVGLEGLQDALSLKQEIEAGARQQPQQRQNKW